MAWPCQLLVFSTNNCLKDFLKSHRATLPHDNVRIHLRSTTCWETSAPRFRDGLVGKEVRGHKEIKAIVEISDLVASSCSTVTQGQLHSHRSTRSAGSCRSVTRLPQHSSRWHENTSKRVESQRSPSRKHRSSARRMDCRDEVHELRALTSRTGHEHACMRIVE